MLALHILNKAIDMCDNTHPMEWLTQSPDANCWYYHFLAYFRYMCRSVLRVMHNWTSIGDP